MNDDKAVALSPAVVTVDYHDLVRNPGVHNDLSTALEQAYGSTSSSLGILAICNVPGFAQAKQSFLPLAHSLSHLSNDYLEANLTDAKSLYNAGWSHGKEKLGDKPDFAKGSFYFNPLTDTPGSAQEHELFPTSYPCNVWPSDHVVPGFEAKAKHLGRLMKDVVVHLAKHIDDFAEKTVADYPENALLSAMEKTEKAKGRLLYYFPLKPSSSDPSSGPNKPAEDSWIGWHNDSGFLTALAGDMYVNDATGQIVDCPDPAAGLYVVDRNDNVVHVDMPKDCMAVQMGECVQVLTGGAVVATPHCVRGAANAPGIARISLPCFIDTPPSYPLCMPKGCTRQDVLSRGVGSSRVPPLGARWTEDGMLFGDFLTKTFSLYYDWTKKSAAA